MQITASRKAERQQAILKVVHEKPVGTQIELKALLRERGIDVDQGTLSRDIRELGLVKTPAEGGVIRYSLVEDVSPVVATKSHRVVARLVKSVAWSGSLVIVKTAAGDASPVGLALDRFGWSEIVGTVAGDDTLFVAVREGVTARKVARKILDLRER
jgi:transcriptional regulator of arginine metabolism